MKWISLKAGNSTLYESPNIQTYYICYSQPVHDSYLFGIYEENQKNPTDGLWLRISEWKFCDVGQWNSHDVMEELLRYYSDDSGTGSYIEVEMKHK